MREGGHLVALAPLGVPAGLERLLERGAHPVHRGEHLVDLAHAARLHGEVEVLARDALGGVGEGRHLAGDGPARAARHEGDGGEAAERPGGEHDVLGVGQRVPKRRGRELGHVVAPEDAEGPVGEPERRVGRSCAPGHLGLCRSLPVGGQLAGALQHRPVHVGGQKLAAPNSA